MLLGIYLSYNTERDMIIQNYEIPTITMNVWTWDRSINQLPTLETISLSFPYGWNNPNSFGCSDTNYLTVKVTAINPNDPDWNISRIKFYNYNVDEPENIEYKDARITTPFVYFILPLWWEYRFWVILYDNNWWVIDSEEIIWKWPSIYLPNTCE